MKIIELDYRHFETINEDLSLCLGYFDGIHLGHKKLILEALLNAKNKVAILTFDRPISTLINNGKSEEILTSNNDRIRLLNHFDIAYFFIIHIDEDFIKLNPDEFVEILKKLGTKEVFAGEDYHYGHLHQGNISSLANHFIIHSIPLLSLEKKKISTSHIISYLKEGDVISANKMLGYNYQIIGKVIHGHHLGNKIGFPTLNIELSSNYVIPKFGVYKTICYISGIPHLSISNVGIHPTINKEEKPIIETYVLNYSDDSYGKTIYLEFIDFIREEKKFDTIDELQEAIKNDIKKFE